MSPASGPLPEHGDLLRMRRQLESTNPELYRQLALYLQVLRQILPHSVDQACFHLATQRQPGRYSALSEAQRRHFHATVRLLVSRCTSLLTVEHLVCLAGRNARKQAPGSRRQPRDRGQTLASQAPHPPRDPEAPAPSHDQQDSVQLGLGLPIEAGWLGWGDGLGFGVPDPSHPSSGPDAEDGDAVLLDPEDQDDGVIAEDLVDLFTALAAAAGMDRGLQGMEPASVPSMAAFSHQADAPAWADGDREADDDLDQADAPDPEDSVGIPLAIHVGEAADRAGDNDPGALFRPPPGGGLLPRDPVALLAWLEGVERALACHLRDLSVALNRELLRNGLIRVLLPVQLLDGVLRGQIEAHATHPNLLHLPLPMAMARSRRIVRADAILLRRADLELEQPRLRTVRSRLQQLRQEGRRMARQYLRLQRRIQAHEAEALWLQDIRSMRPGPAPPC
jgi:hypothetical protein